jgi:hypothetical protein
MDKGRILIRIVAEEDPEWTITLEFLRALKKPLLYIPGSSSCTIVATDRIGNHDPVDQYQIKDEGSLVRLKLPSTESPIINIHKRWAVVEGANFMHILL